MIKTLPNNDLSNPELYAAVINNRNKWVDIKVIELPYDEKMNGTIHTTLSGYKVVFNDGIYSLEDSYGNCIYLSNYANKEKVFSFYAKSIIQFIDDFELMQIEVMLHFKRTNTKFFKQQWAKHHSKFK